MLDEAVFAEVLAMAAEAPDGFLDRLLETFRTNAAEDLASLAEGLEAGDATLVAARAHRLKSGGANWGAARFAAACQALESAARANELAEAPALLERIARSARGPCWTTLAERTSARCPGRARL